MPGPSKLYHFNIADVLHSDKRTTSIISKRIPAGNFIMSQDRFLIATVLAEAIFKHEGLYQSPKVVISVSKNLVRLFPALGDTSEKSLGYEIWSFYPCGGIHASGYLYERINNQRAKIMRDLARQNKDNDSDSDADSKWESEPEDCVESSEDNEADIVWLQTHSTDDKEILDRMSRTVYSRVRLIKQNNGDVFKIKPLMPRLFDIQGMITNDFDLRHPDLKNCLYSSWPKLAQILYKFAQANHIFLSNLGVLDNENLEWTTDQWAAIGLLLLPRLLSHSIRKLNTNTPASHNLSDDDNSDEPQSKRIKVRTRKTSRLPKPIAKKAAQSTVKGGIHDSLESLISFVPVNTSIPEKCKDSTGMYPRIVVLGSLHALTASQIFVVFNTVAVPTAPSFVDAIDCCFKSFFVFGLEFPAECKPIWQFLQYACFNKKKLKTDIIPPAVRALLSQTVPRMPTYTNNF